MRLSAMNCLGDVITDTINRKLFQLSPMKIILLGYCLIILTGALLLSLPISSSHGEPTSFTDAFFTAASATCVTGLIRFDTYTYWSLFGQVVILALIQIGGIGFMTFAIAMAALTRHKIGLAPRYVMQNSISAPQVGGIIRMTKFILIGTLMIELTGAVLLAFRFCPSLGLSKGLWFSVFHSISAFCNAGFDLMGGSAPFSSLTGYAGDWYLNGIIMLLIIIGGLGFFVWKDLLNCRFSFSRLKLHSKLVIFVTSCLIILGTVLLFVLEHNTDSYNKVPVSQQVLQSLFQSVTARTAGFNSIDMAAVTQSGQFLIICLMLIGGSTGSTAGGIKTTTFAVLIMSVVSTVRRRKYIEAFGRRIEEGIFRTVGCVFIMYLTLVCTGAMAISALESLPLLTALFECASAIGTVGLSLGITPELGIISKFILAFLMLFGRVGSITMLLAVTSEKTNMGAKLPVEKIQVG